MATGCDRVRLIWLCENTQRLCAAKYIHVQHYLWVKGRPRKVTPRRPLSRLRDLDGEDVRRTEHVRTEDHISHVGGKRDVGLEPVVMLSEIHKTLGLEIADIDQVFLVAERTSFYHHRPEKVNPLPVSWGIQKHIVGRASG